MVTSATQRASSSLSELQGSSSRCSPTTAEAPCRHRRLVSSGYWCHSRTAGESEAYWGARLPSFIGFPRPRSAPGSLPGAGAIVGCRLDRLCGSRRRNGLDATLAGREPWHPIGIRVPQSRGVGAPAACSELPKTVTDVPGPRIGCREDHSDRASPRRRFRPRDGGFESRCGPVSSACTKQSLPCSDSRVRRSTGHDEDHRQDEASARCSTWELCVDRKAAQPLAIPSGRGRPARPRRYRHRYRRDDTRRLRASNPSHVSERHADRPESIGWNRTLRRLDSASWPNRSVAASSSRFWTMCSIAFPLLRSTARSQGLHWRQTRASSSSPTSPSWSRASSE